VAGCCEHSNICSGSIDGSKAKIIVIITFLNPLFSEIMNKTDFVAFILVSLKLEVRKHGLK
jgi:hypothetical protein